MPGIAVEVHGDLEIVRALEIKSARVVFEAFTITQKFGQLLETGIKSRAQGRPGPRRRTGDYLRSWSTIVTMGPIGPRAESGTSAPQGRRLEYGFVGTDALGRHYNQPPYPHARPALDAIEPGYTAALAGLVSW